METYTTKTLDIIGIGGSSASPNPRLPAYIYPSLVHSESDILLVSSQNGAIEYNYSKKEKDLIIFNTRKKLELLGKFIEEFYPQKKVIGTDYSNETDDIDLDLWLLIWEQFESLLSDEEKNTVYGTLNRYNKSDSLEKAKAYAIRHSFWFKDLSLKRDPHLQQYSSLKSVGGPAESFFNFIREKIDTIPLDTLRSIILQDLTRNKVERLIYAFEHKVVPYGEATRKSGNKVISIEYPDNSDASIVQYYCSSPHCVKSNLNTDIEVILRTLSSDQYQTFWDHFYREYKNDLRNI